MAMNPKPQNYSKRLDQKYKRSEKIKHWKRNLLVEIELAEFAHLFTGSGFTKTSNSSNF